MIWTVTKGHLNLPSGNRMAASCHHRGNNRSLSACGGCYARFRVLLDAIRENPANAIRLIDECTAAMMAESKAKAVKP